MAVEVGTGSPRAALFDGRGKTLARASRAIAMHRPRPDDAEQSGEDIWQALCGAARAAREQAGLSPQAVAGISFDTTCSLAALDREDRPASVSTGGGQEWNVVVWLDHRAIAKAEAGGRIW